MADNVNEFENILGNCYIYKRQIRETFHFNEKNNINKKPPSMKVKFWDKGITWKGHMSQYSNLRSITVKSFLHMLYQPAQIPTEGEMCHVPKPRFLPLSVLDRAW